MYLFVIAFLVRLPASRSHLEGAATRGSVLTEITIGLRYIWASRSLRLLMLMAFVPTILGMPYITLLPGFAVDELGLEADSYGLMFTVTGIGAIVGSILIATLTTFPRKAALQVAAGAGFGLALALLGLLAMAFGYIGAIAALVLLGLCSTMYQTLNATMVMSEARPEFYGRVMSVYMLTFSVFPLMATPIGVVADSITASTTFVILGLGIIAFIVAISLASPGRVLMAVSAPPMRPDGVGPTTRPPGGATPSSAEPRARAGDG
jgi:MFS family permease